MTRKLEVVLALILVGSSLAFGCVQPLAYSVAELLIFLTLILFLWYQKRQGRISLSLPVWPLLFVVWIGFQLVPLPRSLLSAISPAQRMAPAWLAALHHGSAWGTLSIYPDATLIGFFKVLAYLCVFILAIQFFDSGRRKSYLVIALIALGCFEAGYGILQHLLAWNTIFGVTDPYDKWVAIGTYINRNHFAGLIELTMPFVFGAAFHTYEIWSDPRHRTASSRSGNSDESSIGFRIVFFLFLVGMLVVSVVFSFSRGGILAISFTLITLSILAFLKVRTKSWGMIIAGVAVLAVGFSLWIGAGTMVRRFENMDRTNYLGTSTRSMLWQDTVQIFLKNPIVGTGFGTFGEAFRPHQTGLVNMHIDHAHNDYLEFASDTGAIGFCLLFIPIFYLLFRMVQSFLKDHRRYRSAVLLGCIGSTLGLLIHTVTDFNLHIPANAMIFALILGIGYKAACLEPRKEAQDRQSGAR